MKPYLKQPFNKVKLLVAFLIIAFSINANAQKQFTLSGKVMEGVNPLPGASVVLKGTAKGATTDADGNFSFQLKKGIYTLQVSLISQPKEVQVNLNKDVSITLIFLTVLRL